MRHSVFVLLTFVCGCVANITPENSPNKYMGVEGCWLTSGTCEVFVSGKPYPRVVAFRAKSQSSPFRVVTHDECYGIRTWYMEAGGWVDTSLLPAQQQAEIQRLGPLSARLVAAAEPKSGLQLTVEVGLDPHRPVLTIRHGMKNLRSDNRRICLWLLMAVPHNGMAVTPWKSGKDAIRTCLFYPETEASEPCLKLAKSGMGMDFSIPSKSAQCKFGTNTDAGWAGYCWGNQAFVSRVAYQKDGLYIDGGAPVTFYNLGTKREDGFCEVEHVGPLVPLGPGQTTWLEQKITLLKIKSTSDSVDANIAAILDAQNQK